MAQFPFASRHSITGVLCSLPDSLVLGTEPNKVFLFSWCLQLSGGGGGELWERPTHYRLLQPPWINDMGIDKKAPHLDVQVKVSF